MGLLDKIVNVGGAVAQPIDAIGKIVDNVYTSDEEKLDKQALLDRIAQKPALVQGEINKIEAQHRSVFVAGWRPFIGWVCGTALAYGFIFRDLLAWGMRVLAPDVEPPPELAMEHLLSVLLGMLGLGGMRTWEKLKGRAK